MPTTERLVVLPPGSWVLTAYGLGWGAAALASGLYVRSHYDPPTWPGLALGWGVAAAAAAAGLLIKRMALGGDLTRFLVWGLLVSGGRAALLLLIILAVHRSAPTAFPPFVVAVFSGYFSCMVSEIAILHTMTTRGD